MFPGAQLILKVVENFYEDGTFDELLDDVEAKDLHSLVLAGESPMAYRQTRNGSFFSNVSSNEVSIRIASKSSI